MKSLARVSVLLLAGCASVPPAESLPQVRAWVAAGGPAPPPLTSCPTVADVDLAAIAREADAAALGPDRARSDAYFNEIFRAIRITGGARTPPSDALVVLRAVEPPGGMYSNTVWSVVWKERDGGWWFWRQNRTNEPPPPPPPPPPPNASQAERDAYRAGMAAYPPEDHVRWPPSQGRLDPARAAALDAALSNPCRAWEPDRWPWDPPLRRRRAQPAPPPPHDWTPFHVQIEEMGRPPRVITAPNDRPSLAGSIIETARYPR